MKTFKLIISTILLASTIWFSGCTTFSNLNSRIALGYNAVEAYTIQAGSLLQRGRISISQAEQASKNAKQAKAALDYASGASTVCPAAPCTVQDQLLIAENILLQLEQTLKAKEGV